MSVSRHACNTSLASLIRLADSLPSSSSITSLAISCSLLADLLNNSGVLLITSLVVSNSFSSRNLSSLKNLSLFLSINLNSSLAIGSSTFLTLSFRFSSVRTCVSSLSRVAITVSFSPNLGSSSIIAKISLTLSRNGLMVWNSISSDRNSPSGSCINSSVCASNTADALPEYLLTELFTKFAADLLSCSPSRGVSRAIPAPLAANFDTVPSIPIVCDYTCFPVLVKQKPPLSQGL